MDGESFVVVSSSADFKFCGYTRWVVMIFCVFVSVVWWFLVVVVVLMVVMVVLSVV